MKKRIKTAYLNMWHALYRVLPRFSYKNEIEMITHIKADDKHFFRGYYDIDYFDQKCEKFLIHILPKMEEDYNEIGIGYFDLNNKIVVQIAKSNAWCWQQGSRLRWFDSSCVMFNDCLDGNYVCRVVDVITKETIKTFEYPMYDVSLTKGFGLGLNFSRLQRLRPGYGYKSVPDCTEGCIASDTDGIFFNSLTTNYSKLLVSLERLHSIANPVLTGEDYINHICISPEADKFIFFYIVCDEWKKKSKVYLFCSDVLGENIQLLENDVQTSHYTWLDNNRLLTTYLRPTKGMTQGYRIYNTGTGEIVEYGNGILRLDGHPTFVSDTEIITDTYPQAKMGNNQYLYMYNDSNKTTTSLGRFYQDVHYLGERRCDLHPSICSGCISVDTSCEGLRSVVLLKLRQRK